MRPPGPGPVRAFSFSIGLAVREEKKEQTAKPREAVKQRRNRSPRQWLECFMRDEAGLRTLKQVKQ
jgi:hypothetical protein